MLELHVKPSEHGGWDVIEPGSDSSNPVGHYPRKRDAEMGAREMLRRQGGGEAVIYRIRGEIQERDTIEPGSQDLRRSA
jgi:hypothetical protein